MRYKSAILVNEVLEITAYRRQFGIQSRQVDVRVVGISASQQLVFVLVWILLVGTIFPTCNYTSDKYRLRSGIGVGSTRQEIENAFGSTLVARSGNTLFMVYHLAGLDGDPVPVQLTITLDGSVAVEFSLISR